MAILHYNRLNSANLSVTGELADLGFYDELMATVDANQYPLDLLTAGSITARPAISTSLASHSLDSPTGCSGGATRRCGMFSATNMPTP